MKKILLSLAMLLTGVGAWAQTTIELTTDTSSPITYVLESNRPAYAHPHLHFHENKIRFYQPEEYGSVDTNNPSTQVPDHDFLFYFTKASESTFYIHSYVAEPNMVYGVETVGVDQQLVLVDKNNPGSNTVLEWTLADGGSSLKYFKTTVDGVDYCIEDGNGRPSYAELHKVSGTPGNGYVVKLLQKTAPKCSITDAKYATFYAAHTVSIPDGVTAYYVSNIGTNSATLTQIEDYIPANTGAILYSDVAQEYTFNIASYSAASAIEDNMLTGTIDDNTNIQGEAYVLSTNNETGVGFYAAELTDGKFKNNAGKAYLPKPSESGARFLLFDFGTETAIESIQGAESANAVVYDLAGRRVQGAQKGLYIVNGKKVIK